MRYICDNNRQTSGRVSRLRVIFAAAPISREDFIDRKCETRKGEKERKRERKKRCGISFTCAYLTESFSEMHVHTPSRLRSSSSPANTGADQLFFFFYTLDGLFSLQRYLFLPRLEAAANCQVVSLVRIGGKIRLTAAGYNKLELHFETL